MAKAVGSILRIFVWQTRTCREVSGTVHHACDGRDASCTFAFKLLLVGNAQTVMKQLLSVLNLILSGQG